MNSIKSAFNVFVGMLKTKVGLITVGIVSLAVILFLGFTKTSIYRIPIVGNLIGGGKRTYRRTYRRARRTYRRYRRRR